MIDDCSTLGIIPKLKDNFTLSFSMGIHNNNRLVSGLCLAGYRNLVMENVHES